METLKIIGLCVLIVAPSLAKLAFAVEPGPAQAVSSGKVQISPSGQDGKKIIAQKSSGLAEMREWLNQRNTERKQKGSGMPDSVSRSKQNPAVTLPHITHRQKRPLTGLLAGDKPRPSQESAGEQTVSSPDGRVHHRLIMNEEGPDQLQVDTGKGYAIPYTANSLKPKGWNHPKFGLR